MVSHQPNPRRPHRPQNQSPRSQAEPPTHHGRHPSAQKSQYSSEPNPNRSSLPAIPPIAQPAAEHSHDLRPNASASPPAQSIQQQPKRQPDAFHHQAPSDRFAPAQSLPCCQPASNQPERKAPSTGRTSPYRNRESAQQPAIPDKSPHGRLSLHPDAPANQHPSRPAQISSITSSGVTVPPPRLCVFSSAINPVSAR